MLGEEDQQNVQRLNFLLPKKEPVEGDRRSTGSNT